MVLSPLPVLPYCGWTELSGAELRREQDVKLGSADADDDFEGCRVLVAVVL